MTSPGTIKSAAGEGCTPARSNSANSRTHSYTKSVAGSSSCTIPLHHHQPSAMQPSTSNSSMNPLAVVFIPPATQTTASAISPPAHANDLYELRASTDRGFGLFALKTIPLGTLIICEEALVRTSADTWAAVWAPYQDLTDEQRATYDALLPRDCPSSPLEQRSLSYLANNVDTPLPNGDVQHGTADHVRIMKIFACNAYELPKEGLVVFATTARLNHSCLPNVERFYNRTLKSMTVHAVRDILPGEELLASYLGSEGTYMSSAERNARLSNAHGFICHCSACSDATGASDWRRIFLRNLSLGLQQYCHGLITPHPFIPTDPASALKQAEDHISCLMEEQIWTTDLAKAYHVASAMAFNLRDLNRALEYARDEEVVQRNCLGTQLDEFKNQGYGTLTWLETVLKSLKDQSGETSKVEAVLPIGSKKRKIKNKRNKAKHSETEAVETHSNGQKATDIAKETQGDDEATNGHEKEICGSRAEVQGHRNEMQSKREEEMERDTKLR